MSKAALYRELGLPLPHDPNLVDYYHLLDGEAIIAQMYGTEVAKWAVKKLKPNEALFRIAQRSGVVLLPGKGFGTPHPSGRVSLANLNEYDYANIGKALREMAADYYEQFQAQVAKTAKKSKK